MKALSARVLTVLLVAFQSDTTGSPHAATTVSPAWIQAVAALLSFGATAWLAILTSRYVRATDRIARSTQQQVEDSLANSRRQRRAVAEALLEEVRRIRTRLGVRPKEGELPEILPGATASPGVPAIVLSAEPPEIHQWFRPVIPQVAESSASIVGLFLKLDDGLRDYRGDVRGLREAKLKLEQEEATLERFVGRYEHTAERMYDITDWRNTDYAVRLANANVEAAERFAKRAYAGCHGTLDALDQALTAVLEPRRLREGSV